MSLIDKYLGEKKVFVSAYWSGNALVWRTEDGRTGSDPMKTKNKKTVQKHMEKVLGSKVDLELLGEGYKDKKLPKEAKMIATKAGMTPQAYVVNNDGTISVWEKNKKKGWSEWWQMDKQQFKAEFGIKV